MEWEHNPNYQIIIDNGSYQIKAALASSPEPTIVMKNLTGSLKLLNSYFLLISKQ